MAEENILVAHVHVGDSVCIVRAEEISKALISLHGVPKEGMRVKASIEYVFLSAELFADMEEFDKAGISHSRFT